MLRLASWQDFQHQAPGERGAETLHARFSIKANNLGVDATEREVD